MDNSSIEISQHAGLGGQTTQIAQQNNYIGMTPEEVSQVAIKLFMENFPKLQDIAKTTAEARAQEFCQAVIEKLIEEKINDFSPFSDPDVQYVLLDAQKNYARFGTADMLKTLSDLISRRVAHDEDFSLKVSIDKAIEVTPMIFQGQLDYLSILFMCTQTKVENIKTLDGLEQHLKTIEMSFSNADFSSVSYLNMLGCLQVQIHDTVDNLSNLYKFEKQDIEQICPQLIKRTTGDYTTSYVGTILAITNAESKTNLKFNPKIWIK